MAQRTDSASALDPFGLWRELRDSQLEAWSKAMVELVNSEPYARAMGLAIESYLTTSAPYRQLLEQVMLQALQQAQMPSRADLAGLAERLTNIEFRLDDLDAALAARTPAPTATGGPGRREEGQQ